MAFFCLNNPVYGNWGGSESGKSCRKTLFGGRCRWWWWILVPSALSVGVESCCCFAFLPFIALVYNHVFDVRHFILRLNASVILWLAAEVLWEIKQKKSGLTYCENVKFADPKDLWQKGWTWVHFWVTPCQACIFFSLAPGAPSTAVKTFPGTDLGGRFNVAHFFVPSL